MGVRQFTQRVSMTRFSMDSEKRLFSNDKQKLLNELHSNARDIRNINFILDSLLFNGAYSEKNLEQRLHNFDKLNVPKWEKDIVVRANTKLRNLSHDGLLKLDIILSDNDNLSNSRNNKKMNSDIDNAIDNTIISVKISKSNFDNKYCCMFTSDLTKVKNNDEKSMLLQISKSLEQLVPEVQRRLNLLSHTKPLKL